MSYIVVSHESVLSRVSPDALLSWIDYGVSRATEYRYAVLFETCSGALKCAGMQGGSPYWVTDVGGRGDTGGGVVRGGDACGLVEVE